MHFLNSELREHITYSKNKVDNLRDYLWPLAEAPKGASVNKQLNEGMMNK